MEYKYKIGEIVKIKNEYGVVISYNNQLYLVERKNKCEYFYEQELKKVKQLKIHLCSNYSNENIISSLDDFNNLILDIKDKKNNDHYFQTYCLAGLNLNYLDFFEILSIYGKYKCVTFQNSKNGGVEYHVYDLENEVEITKKYLKEIRKAHNLYRMIISGYFGLNESNLK